MPARPLCHKPGRTRTPWSWSRFPGPAAPRRTGWRCGHGSCCWPRPDWRPARSPEGTSICQDTARKWRRRYCKAPSAGWRMRRGPAGRARSPPGSWPRSRPWPARCPPRAGRRWPAGPAPSWPARRRPAGIARRALGVHGAPLARRRRDQALAAPVVDLPPRPALRPQGRPRPGPLPAGMGRAAAGRGRVRPQRRREARRPGPHAHPPPAAARAPAGRCGPRASTTASAPSGELGRTYGRRDRLVGEIEEVFTAHPLAWWSRRCRGSDRALCHWHVMQPA